MKRISVSLFFIALIAIVLWPLIARASVTASTGTVTETNEGRSRSGEVFCHTYAWLSDEDGDCVATISDLRGEILRVVINPDGGATAPTTLYDVTLTDRDAVSVIGSAGANLSATVTSEYTGLVGDGGVVAAIPRAVFGDLALSIEGAGDSNGGIIRIYMRQ